MNFKPNVPRIKFVSNYASLRIRHAMRRCQHMSFADDRTATTMGPVFFQGNLEYVKSY